MRLSTAALCLVALAHDAAGQAPGLTGTLIVTNKTPSTATMIDVASGRTLATIATGAGPHEIVLARDASIAVVTDYSGQPGRTLTVIDVPAMRVARTIELAAHPRPHGIAFLPGDSIVAVTSEQSGHVVLVNVRTGAIRQAIPTRGIGSHMVGVTADGARAYTGNMRSNTISELDLRAGAFLRSLPVPTIPEAINVTPDGREAWVGSNNTGKVSVVDVATWTVSTAGEGFAWPYRMLFTPDAKTVLIPDMTNEDLRFIDRATRREVGKIPFPGAGPQGITTTPDGRYALLSLSRQARVAIVDIAERKVVGFLQAGETPDGIAFTPRVFGPGR
ncbi:MAG TPA: hypothetical protein VFO55_00740 [Gemmatimonadaceae bacterium]|nr:hypothetical protein [Gemmatimonadaceae bacterium]